MTLFNKIHLVHLLKLMSTKWNYLWISNLASTALSFTSDKREVDCFDGLTISFVYVNNLTAFNFSIDWFDARGQLIFTETTVCPSPSTGPIAFYSLVKGEYAQIRYNVTSLGGFSSSLSVILVAS